MTPPAVRFSIQRTLLIVLSLTTVSVRLTADTIPITGTTRGQGATKQQVSISGPELTFAFNLNDLGSGLEAFCSSDPCQLTVTSHPFSAFFQCAGFSAVCLTWSATLDGTAISGDNLNPDSTGTVDGAIKWVSDPFNFPAGFFNITVPIMLSGEILAFQNGSSVPFLDFDIAAAGTAVVGGGGFQGPPPGGMQADIVFVSTSFSGAATTHVPEPQGFLLSGSVLALFFLRRLRAHRKG